MIGTFIAIKFKTFFKSLRKPSILLANIGLLIGAVLYGLIFGFAYNEFNQEMKPIIDNAPYYLTAILCFFSFIRIVTPSYVPQLRHLLAYYPVSSWPKYVLHVVSDFQKGTLFYLFLFLSIFFGLAKGAPVSLFVGPFLGLVVGNLAKRFVQYPIDFTLNKKGRASVIPVIGVVALCIIGAFTFKLLVLGFVFAAAALFFGGYVLDNSILEKKIKMAKNTAKISNVYFKMIWNDKKKRNLLFIAFVSKLLILMADVFIVQLDGKHLFDGNGAYWFFASPLILFSYVFNNSLGYFRSLWLLIQFQKASLSAIIRPVFKILGVLLLIDAVLTVPFLLYTWENWTFILSFYFTAGIVMSLFSVLWSVLYPKKITSFAPKRGSSSYLGVSVGLAIVLLLSLLQKSGWFYLLIPFLLLCGLVALKMAYVLFPEKKYKIFATLYREE